jgi:hypothetical protein
MRCWQRRVESRPTVAQDLWGLAFRILPMKTGARVCTGAGSRLQFFSGIVFVPGTTHLFLPLDWFRTVAERLLKQALALLLLLKRDLFCSDAIERSNSYPKSRQVRPSRPL